MPPAKCWSINPISLWANAVTGYDALTFMTQTHVTQRGCTTVSSTLWCFQMIEFTCVHAGEICEKATWIPRTAYIFIAVLKRYCQVHCSPHVMLVTLFCCFVLTILGALGAPKCDLFIHISQGWLTHFPLDKMASFSQTIFSDAFSWMTGFVFWLKFRRSLFLRVQLTISQHWFS